MAEVTFCDEQFELPERASTMALMEYANVAVQDVDSGSLIGLAALYSLLEESIGPDHWDRFKALAKKHKVDDDALFQVVRDVFASYAERPTGRPSDSSDGPQSTSARSGGDAFSRAKDSLEAKGRPDLAVVVMNAQEAQAG